MIKKYSVSPIETVVIPNDEDEDKFTKKTREALEEPKQEIVKEADKPEQKPFWINK